MIDSGRWEDGNARTVSLSIESKLEFDGGQGVIREGKLPVHPTESMTVFAAGDRHLNRCWLAPIENVLTIGEIVSRQ